LGGGAVWLSHDDDALWNATGYDPNVHLPSQPDCALIGQPPRLESVAGGAISLSSLEIKICRVCWQHELRSVKARKVLPQLSECMEGKAWRQESDGPVGLQVRPKEIDCAIGPAILNELHRTAFRVAGVGEGIAPAVPDCSAIQPSMSARLNRHVAPTLKLGIFRSTAKR